MMVNLSTVLFCFCLQLSTRRQDLIPRAILCLTKVAKQHFALTQDRLAQEALVSCAQEHINLLKVPKSVLSFLFLWPHCTNNPLRETVNLLCLSLGEQP